MNEPLIPASVPLETVDPSPPPAPNGSLQTVALVILTTLAIFYTLSVAAEIVIPLMLAVMLKLMLQPVMRFLNETLRLPIAVAAFFVMVALFAVVAALGLTIAVPATGWVSRAPEMLNKLEDSMSIFRAPIAALQYIVERADHIAGVDSAAPAAAIPAPASSGIASVGLSVVLGTQQFFGRLLILVVTLFFMLAAGDTMLRRLVEVMPGFDSKKHTVHIVNEIERNISGYLATITAINAAVGVITGIALWLCGLTDALLWGTFAFVLNFVPIIGPIVGVVVLFVVGIFTYSHALPALLVALLYFAIHVTESQLFTPLLLARRFTLNPMLVIISLFFWNWLWGVPGALLSVPLLAAFKIVCDRIPSLAPLGHLLGAPTRREA